MPFSINSGATLGRSGWLIYAKQVPLDLKIREINKFFFVDTTLKILLD